MKRPLLSGGTVGMLCLYYKMKPSDIAALTMLQLWQLTDTLNDYLESKGRG